ncbi:MAG: cyclic-di-AMP receptor [Clostridia bacterium]|nr:cyclic-di-AMP receptor [Clostridia bacterium]
MKLVFAIVQNDDARKVLRDLVKNDFHVTRIASTGGFLYGGNATLMIGVEDERLDACLDVIKHKSSTRKEFMVIPTAYPGSGFADSTTAPVPVMLGGATVFVLDVESYHKF